MRIGLVERSGTIGDMSVSAAQAEAFYREVLREQSVWAIRDDGGFSAPVGDEGKRVQPFWSLRSRADNVIDRVPAYQGFVAVEITLAEWRERWLPGLERDGLLVGLNWSGTRATGYDVEPADITRALEARRT